VHRTIATTNGNHPIGNTNVSVSMLVYVKQGSTLDLSGLPTTTSLTVGPWPGPNWVVTLDEQVVLISVDYPSSGRIHLKEKIHSGRRSQKANIFAEHGSFPLALGPGGVNLTFQISTRDDAIEIKEETRNWIPIGLEKKDEPLVQKGVFCRCCDGKMQFKLDPEGHFGTSTSGLSSIVATTGGRVRIPGTNMLAMINAFKKIQGAQRSQELQEIEEKKRKARAKKLASEKKAKAKGVKKEAAAEEILSAIAQKIRQVARSRKGVIKGKPKMDVQASSPALKSALASKIKKVVSKADTNGNTKADDDDDAPVTLLKRDMKLLKRPLLPSKGTPEPPAKKARPADTETNGKKDASGSNVAAKSAPSTKVEKVKSKKQDSLKKGAPMNHRNVTTACQAYMKKHPEWTLSLMREEISEDYDWENGPKLKMFISTALKAAGGSSRGGNVAGGYA
jgi:hypothetical protein